MFLWKCTHLHRFSYIHLFFRKCLYLSSCQYTYLLDFYLIRRSCSSSLHWWHLLVRVLSEVMTYHDRVLPSTPYKHSAKKLHSYSLFANLKWIKGTLTAEWGLENHLQIWERVAFSFLLSELQPLHHWHLQWSRSLSSQRVTESVKRTKRNILKTLVYERTMQ